MNKWKVAFFMLASAIIIAIGFIIYWATSPLEDPPIPSTTKIENPSNESTLLVETTAKDFEKLAMKYLGGELNQTEFPVEFVINDQIQLFSELVIFGVSVPISMDFEPVVGEDGNISLKQKKVNVGSFNIPPTTVLRLMRDAIDFPEWVTIRPDAEEIFVDLSNLSVAEGSKVKAKEIDLANDRILLEVTVPNE